MSTVRPEPVEGLCFDGLSTNELANKSGRINSLTRVDQAVRHLVDRHPRGIVQKRVRAYPASKFLLQDFSRENYYQALLRIIKDANLIVIG
jgi:hypothetical protein